jgi:hypothetical protein
MPCRIEKLMVVELKQPLLIAHQLIVIGVLKIKLMQIK